MNNLHRELAPISESAWASLEQAGKGRAFNAHTLGNFLLGQFVSALREMDQRPPFALAQAERAQALVELGAPGPGGAEEHLAEFVGIRGGHWPELVSVLTNRVSRHCQIPSGLIGAFVY